MARNLDGRWKWEDKPEPDQRIDRMDNPFAPVNANLAAAQVDLVVLKILSIWTNFQVKAHPIHVRNGGMHG
jgi:hypothetical protein